MTEKTMTLHEALAAVRGGHGAADKPVPANLAEALAQVRARRPAEDPQKPAGSAPRNWWETR